MQQYGFNAALTCGETKLSSVFKMANAPSAADARYHKPIEQCLYCIMNDTRYGVIIADEELVLLRVRSDEISSGADSVEYYQQYGALRQVLQSNHRCKTCLCTLGRMIEAHPSLHGAAWIRTRLKVSLSASHFSCWLQWPAHQPVPRPLGTATNHSKTCGNTTIPTAKPPGRIE